jgi:DNA anti-recombination protein RmuC
MLARQIADGFGEVKSQFGEVYTRLDAIDVRLDEVDGRLISLEKGQTETHRRLDSIEKKQIGMLESLDETVHQSEFRKLVQRVEVLEVKR